MDLHVDRYKENISKENRENMIKMILERYVTNFQKKNSGSDEKKFLFLLVEEVDQESRVLEMIF